MVFQHFNLFPHFSVLKNIMFAPRELGILNEREARDTALRLLERVGTKFAVRTISEGLRKEEYANNIRTTIISQGMVTTNLRM
ncbi:ABC-type polar amino acid transport system ATPase subunit [Paenibacillus sp. RC254]